MTKHCKGMIKRNILPAISQYRGQVKVNLISKQFAMTSSRNENLREVEVQLPLGGVKGLQRKTIYDEVYNSFEGVPYGKPPLGDLRFKQPEPVEPWSDIRDCTEFTTIPVQKGEGSEDCLYLNVYSKTLTSDQLLPVMVFLYGGAFVGGDCNRSHYGPDYLMFEQVVLVVPNYRVGALGFLSLNDADCQVPGNAGLKDQLLALQWVKQNIEYFNGDCNNITLMGESAGAFSAQLLMASKKSEGLFHKAIVMSASVCNPWGFAPANDAAFKLAKANGYSGENNDKCVLEHLCQLNAHDLTHDSGSIDRTAIFEGKFSSFVPTIEPYDSHKRVIDKTPLEMLRDSWSNDIPLMLGGASFEGLILYNGKEEFSKLLEMLVNHTELLLPAEIRQLHSPEELKRMGQSLCKIHFGDEAREKDPWLQLLDLFSYKLFWHGISRTARSRLQYAKGPTYLYRFDFDSPFFNLYRDKFCGSNMRGVSHADINGYLFFLRTSFKLETDTPEYQTIRRMVGMWTAFAANSNPNCTEISTTNWEPLTENNPFRILNISNNLEMMELPEKEKLEVWDSFYTKTDLF